VHAARGLEAVVAADELLLEQSLADEVLADDLAADRFDELDALLEGESAWTDAYWEGMGSNWELTL
jgi:hypothetical protein